VNCKTCPHIGTYISGMDKMYCHKHEVWTSIYNDDKLCLDTLDAEQRRQNIENGFGGQMSLFSEEL
jgi:hypothetical protein